VETEQVQKEKGQLLVVEKKVLVELLEDVEMDAVQDKVDEDSIN
jgi:hypothetical protein